MSKRDWLRFLTALTFSLVALLIVANGFVLVWSQYQTERDRYEAYQKRADEQTKESADEIARDCTVIPLVNPALINCLREKVEAYQKKDTSNKDLEAQQRMAYWAFVAAIVSAGGLVISVGGLIMLFLSLRQTRQAISNDRKIGEAQVRAYLSLEHEEQHVFGKLEPGAPFSVDMKIINSGQSPAHNVRYLAALMPLVLPLPEDQEDLLFPAEQHPDRGVTIAAGGNTRIDAHLIETLEAEEIESMLNGGTLLLATVAIVTYWDVFKREERKTRFCAYLSRGTDGFDPIKKLSFRRYEWSQANAHNEST